MLSEALTSDPIHSELLQKVSASGALKDRIVQRSTALQVLLPPAVLPENHSEAGT